MIYIKLVSSIGIFLFTAQFSFGKGRENSRDKTSHAGDRFIPNRRAMNESLELSHQKLVNSSFLKDQSSNLRTRANLKDYTQALVGKTAQEILKEPILKFSNSKETENFPFEKTSPIINQYIFDSNVTVKDLPGYSDDFYSNNLSILDDQMAVALSGELVLARWGSPTDAKDMVHVHFREGFTATVVKVLSRELVTVGGCYFLEDGLTPQKCEILVFKKEPDQSVLVDSVLDLEKFIPNTIVEIPGSNKKKYLIGSRSKVVGLFDISRLEFQVQRELESQVITLTFSPDGKYLAVGTDKGGLLYKWPSFTLVNMLKTIENAAVKGLSWNPKFPNLLAYGGGLADKKVRIFDVNDMEIVSEESVQGQVTSLAWAENGDTLVSALGYSNPRAQVWKLRLGNQRTSLILLHEFFSSAAARGRYLDLHLKYVPLLNEHFVYLASSNEVLVVFNYKSNKKRDPLKKPGCLEMPELR